MLPWYLQLLDLRPGGHALCLRQGLASLLIRCCGGSTLLGLSSLVAHLGRYGQCSAVFFAIYVFAVRPIEHPLQVGVAKYLSWPETTWMRRLSSGHHIWFLPLIICTVGIPSLPGTNIRSAPISELCWRLCGDYALSLCIMAPTAIASRWLTPFRLKVNVATEKMQSETSAGTMKGGDNSLVYMNVNLVRWHSKFAISTWSMN